MLISTQNLISLPDIQTVKSISQSIAVLDAIIQPEWQFRYYSFDSQWSENGYLASMRNGSGDEYYIVFDSDGAILKGFTHESKIWSDICKNDKLLPNFLAQVPNCFTKAITEPALEFQYSSFCIWRTYLDSNWNLVNYHLPSQEDNDLSDDLLFILDGKPETYKQWGESYYERPINLEHIRYIYNHQTLNKKIVEEINPSLLIDDLIDDLNAIAYPYLLHS